MGAITQFTAQAPYLFICLSNVYCFLLPLETEFPFDL